MFRPLSARLARTVRPITQHAQIRGKSQISPAAASLSAARTQQQQSRSISGSPNVREKPHPGQYSRTDPEVTVEYPEDHELPSSQPVRGHGGGIGKPTLASFSLEGRVGVVTGGARGLGLVMGQGMVYSGSDLAIVDLNSEFRLGAALTSSLLDTDSAQRRRQSSKPRT